MQKTFTITTSDNHTILWIVDSAEKLSEAVVVFVHGLSWNSQEHHYYNAPKFFVPHGFDTLRFNLYGRHEWARALKHSTLSTHTSDLNDVISTLSKQYKHIMLVWHSLAVFSLLSADHTHINKLVLRDPSSPLIDIQDKKWYYISETKTYALAWGMDILLSEVMVQERKEYNIKQAIRNIQIPTKIIFAGDNNKIDLREEFIPHFKISLDQNIVPWAGHCFYEEGTLEKLYEETLKFLKP